MVLPVFGGCLWPADPACFSDEWAAMDTIVQDRSLAYASATLSRLTGGRVGQCPITVRPYGQSGMCFIPGYTSAFSPGLNVAGYWVNNCGWSLSSDVPGVKLPAPVGRVDLVKINGTVVSSADYKVVQGRTLVFTGSVKPPYTQDVSLPDTATGTFSVTYLNAYPVDSLGANAVALLAMEFAKACTGGKGCKLPTGVTQITRQGVSVNIVSTAFPDGLTGIREVDTFIMLWNPGRLREATRVWSPDMARVSW